MEPDSSSQQQARRRKKNKYEKFSKVEGEVDPMDKLIAESNQKLEELEQENVFNDPKHQLQRMASDIFEESRNRPMFFPDTKNIDPYDPATFGYVRIGTVVGPHGVHGELKIKSETDFPRERFCTPGVRHLKLPNKRAPRRVILLEGRPTIDDEYLIRVADVGDRDEAVVLRGSILYARDEDEIAISPDDEDEHLVSDLVNLDVFLLKENNERNGTYFVGTVVGVVLAEEISSVPGLHDMLEIRLSKSDTSMPSFRDEMVLVPLVKDIVPHVDISGGALYIDPPEGLLDLTYVRKEKVRIKGFLPSARD